MFNLRKTVLLLAAAGTMALAGATTASAATYPARAEVNGRLAAQHAQIVQDKQDGKIGPAKAHRLHMADRHIRRQEKRMAMRDGKHGHLTAHQIKKLNREETRVDRKIPR